MVFLDDKTFDSQWCRGEVMTTARSGIPVFSMVQADIYHIRDLTTKLLTDQPAATEVAFSSQVLAWYRQTRDLSVATVVERIKQAAPITAAPAAPVTPPEQFLKKQSTAKLLLEALLQLPKGLERQPALVRTMLGKARPSKGTVDIPLAEKQALWVWLLAFLFMLLAKHIRNTEEHFKDPTGS